MKRILFLATQCLLILIVFLSFPVVSFAVPPIVVTPTTAAPSPASGAAGDKVTALSNCVITKVGNPKEQPTIPVGCTVIAGGAPLTGITLPPNLTNCLPVGPQVSNGIPGEYCQMPKSLDGSYELIKGSKWQDWGSKELIGVLYTVAQNFKTKYPAGHIIIGDITSDYHLEHFYGYAVDITATTNGKDCVADMLGGNYRCRYGKYNAAATLEYGKMIVNTGYFDTIWFNDTVGVNNPLFAYAKNIDPKRYTSNSPGKTGIRYLADHDDHFHLDIDRTHGVNGQPQHDDNHNTHRLKSELKKCDTLSGALRDVCY